MRVRTVFLAAIAALGPTLAWGFDLKGVELGKFASHEQLHAALGIPCVLGKCGVGHTVIASANCETSVKFNDEKMVDEIVARFSFGDFQLVASALTSKYGPPTEHGSNPIVSATGNNMTRTVAIWRDADGNELAVVDHADVVHGELVLRTKARIERDKEKAKEI
jgi:hypothetical protein